MWLACLCKGLIVKLVQRCRSTFFCAYYSKNRVYCIIIVYTELLCHKYFNCCETLRILDHFLIKDVVHIVEPMEGINVRVRK